MDQWVKVYGTGVGGSANKSENECVEECAGE